MHAPCTAAHLLPPPPRALLQLVADAVADPDLEGLLRAVPGGGSPEAAVSSPGSPDADAASSAAAPLDGGPRSGSGGSGSLLITGLNFEDVRRAGGDSNVAAVAATLRAARWRGVGAAAQSADATPAGAGDPRSSGGSSEALRAKACASPQFRDFVGRLIESAVLACAREAVSGAHSLLREAGEEEEGGLGGGDGGGAFDVDDEEREEDEERAHEARLAALLSQDDNV